MTNLEELLAAIEELKVSLLNAVMSADSSKAMEQWLEMEVEPDSVVAVEPEVLTVEMGGQLFRMVQTHPFKPEGGGGGIMYPLGSGGSGTVRLYGNGEAFVEVEQK